MTKIDFAIVTAIKIERQNVCQAFDMTDNDRVRVENRTYWRKRLPLSNDNFYEIVVAQSLDMANVNAALLTNDMRHHWKPEAVLMVGIAATAKSESKQHLGDIVIGKDIYYYELGKIIANGKLPEPKQIPVDSTLLDRVQALPEKDFTILVKRPDDTNTRPKIDVGVIASGDNVIADAKTRDKIAAANRKIWAIEMEGYGVIEAARQTFNPIRCLVIRALCDYADETKNKEWQPYAAAVAAGFTKHFLLDEPLEPRNNEESTKKTLTVSSGQEVNNVEAERETKKLKGKITWVHLSDWHQRGRDFDRRVVRNALIKDIRNRENIDSNLTKIDFIVFSGDLAFSGKKEEYKAAKEYLLDPVLKVTELSPDRLFIVPGNHDFDRDSFDLLPAAISKPFSSDNKVKEWLDNSKKLARLLEPFEAYEKFVTEYTGQIQSSYRNIQRLEIEEKKIALLGLNSALMSGRNRDNTGNINDDGFLCVGEPQFYDALNQIENDHLRIAILHHPFDWLARFERSQTKESLTKVCHFVLQGHQHRPEVNVSKGTGGNCVIIPAGASYDRRRASDSRYTNAYNFVHLNFDEGKGIVYLRRWSDNQNKWIEDIDSYPQGYLLFDLPKELR